MKLIDTFGRIHNYIRISLTDKCNLNCIYCNPRNRMDHFYSNRNILSYEELYRLLKIFVCDLEVTKIRFTGGELLIRKDILSFFEMISEFKKERPFEMGITTNGTTLEDKIEKLHLYGLDRINTSLDTLEPQRFIAVTGKDLFQTTLRSIEKASTLFKNTKINTVIIKDINDDELTNFIDRFINTNLNIRFIEYMPFSGNGWDAGKFISWEEMKGVIERKYKLNELQSDGDIAKDFLVGGSQLKVSFISSISNHFCDSCNRLRVTASGEVKLCLFSSPLNISLKEMLADNSAADGEIAASISNSLKQKWYKHPNAEELVSLNNNMMSIGG